MHDGPRPHTVLPIHLKSVDFEEGCERFSSARFLDSGGGVNTEQQPWWLPEDLAESLPMMKCSA